jgi:hypothetical protein
MEYRKQVELPTGSDYWFVHMGPVPNKPDWHQKLYDNSSYAFPTKAAAELFAKTHQDRYPGRQVYVKQGE